MMPANVLELIHVAPPSAVRQRPCDELNAHALSASFGWTTRRPTSASGPLTFDHVAPPSMLRKTPAALPAQTTAGSLVATTTALTAPPSGPDELQPAKPVDAMRRRERRTRVGLISECGGSGSPPHSESY